MAKFTCTMPRYDFIKVYRTSIIPPSYILFTPLDISLSYLYPVWALVQDLVGDGDWLCVHMCLDMVDLLLASGGNAWTQALACPLSANLVLTLQRCCQDFETSRTFVTSTCVLPICYRFLLTFLTSITWMFHTQDKLCKCLASIQRCVAWMQVSIMQQWIPIIYVPITSPRKSRCDHDIDINK